MEPPHTYIREASASVAHHADYLDRRDTHALCGAAIDDVTTLTDPDTVCPECEQKLIQYHLAWWRETALAATAEVEALRAKYGEAVESDATTAEPEETEPTTLLDHARRELTKLCREFDDAVPYFRLKNAMQAFSDGLESDQRVLLAQEIGGDGTLIRWSTMEVETLGWHVSNSPVQGDSGANWDAWVQDSYQSPKKSKRRFGRAR
ncbi:hypothetical protein [Mycolicibacterium tusciae]|uniref:hypothetical protein n=1 Tax=Mycolicibacterium tusciae TaxID=75922 RepID=UPI0009F32E1A|nr:hypothetical protein [Mycolicibacterium tusciae]